MKSFVDQCLAVVASSTTSLGKSLHPCFRHCNLPTAYPRTMTENFRSALGNEYFERLFNAKDSKELTAVYDEWATKYNKDLQEQEYVAPTLAAQAVQTYGRIDGVIFDAGCGTGLSGIALAQAGAKAIDGVDLSQGMLDIARETGVYRNLEVADLSTRLTQKDNAYEVITCVGTLTHGHVGPDPALSEFVRIVQKGGIVVATVLDDVWSTEGYKQEVDRLKEEGKVEVLSVEKSQYRAKAAVQARMVVLKKR